MQNVLAAAATAAAAVGAVAEAKGIFRCLTWEQMDWVRVNTAIRQVLVDFLSCMPQPDSVMAGLHNSRDKVDQV